MGEASDKALSESAGDRVSSRDRKNGCPMLME